MAAPSAEQRIPDLGPERKAVLATSRHAGLEHDTAANWLASLSSKRFASLALQQEKAAPLIQPRGGMALFDHQLKLSQALAASGADFIPLTIDSHTRHNDYETAQTLLERSLEEDENFLNGYPLVNHGYETTRALYENIEQPISLRHGTPDARLLVETALASGITEIEGGALTYTVPYARHFPIKRALLIWQYIDRLCAELSTAERPINRESFGVLTATMVPPAMVAAIELCELLLAAEQGVRSFSMSFGQSGSMVQDAALALVLRELGAHYLDAFGLTEMSVHLVYHQWMGAFPPDHRRAEAIIGLSTQIASLIMSDKIVVKTRDEARGIPTIESNCQAVELVRFLQSHSRMREPVTSPEIQKEADRIRASTEIIMNAIFEKPGADFWLSVAEAFEEGIIDVPFSPHDRNANRLRTRRGRNDGIFIVDPGSVPMSDDVLEAERAAILDAERRSRPNTIFAQAMHDIDLMLS